ncbi:hypothetical protein DPMN_178680 [Dreissena polymorpha]|uniref:Uncharacterized protein n=1 Tax=Dreissena polymorpha TaxID=45954 RepID=A0A9D4EFJ3_DREPO|nr:hypothetical protein DPMN_178680 [Dreissena polymorpha]
MTTFKYLGATLSKDSTSTAEVRIRIALATSAITRLSGLWTSSWLGLDTSLGTALCATLFSRAC